MSRVEAAKTLFQEALLPSTDVAAVAAQFTTDLGVRLSPGEGQDEPGAPHLVGPKGSRSNPSFKFSASRVVKH